VAVQLAITIRAPVEVAAVIVAALGEVVEFRDAALADRALEGSPADFGKLIADETEKWGKVVVRGHQG
jgi:hypothetical protein